MIQTNDELRVLLLSDYLLFTQFFYLQRTGREFQISNPVSRPSHHRIIGKLLTEVLRLDIQRLLINIPPGHSKSEMIIHFIAWAMARYPDSAFLYISYGFELAAKHTHTIKQIMDMPMYQELFGIQIRHDSKSKDYFMTTAGGFVKAFGSGGGITGYDGGLPHLDRFSGAIIMDDMHKPDDVHSDTMRESVWNNYQETIMQRRRSPNTPMIFIGQRLHEDDLPAKLINNGDGYNWTKVILKAIDDAGNALYPELYPLHDLLIQKDKSPYVFSAQQQQDPLPSGGGIFSKDNFVLKDEEPELLLTFITADSAETDKNYNDATVFSFWGVYKIKLNYVDTEIWGLHWIDCMELRIEPKDLEREFLQFWADCMRHKIKPTLSVIEKKSTGTTLVSILKATPGLEVLGIDRTVASKSKTQRYLSIQQFVNNKQISLPRYGKHTHMCIEHMGKITANDSHRWDDIADTAYDACRLVFIDKFILSRITNNDHQQKTAKLMTSQYNKLKNLRSSAHGSIIR